MKMRFLATAVAVVALSLSAIAGSVNVGVVYLENGTSTVADAAITAGGGTPVDFASLATANLSTVQVLFLLNPDNGAYSSDLTSNLAKLDSFVAGGGVLSFFDREVTDGASVVPGCALCTFTRDLGTNIDVQTSGTLVTNGPGGVVDNTTLDGGNFSDHGYVDINTLPAGAVSILNNGTAGNIVDFSYLFGLGTVNYSTVPLDFYLSGGGSNANFANIYAPNEVAYQIAAAGPATVPEPTSLALLGGGLLSLGALIRRLKSS